MFDFDSVKPALAYSSIGVFCYSSVFDSSIWNMLGFSRLMLSAIDSPTFESPTLNAAVAVEVPVFKTAGVC